MKKQNKKFKGRAPRCLKEKQMITAENLQNVGFKRPVKYTFLKREDISVIRIEDRFTI